MTNNRIPSEADFARAAKLMADRDRHLDEVSADVEHRFSRIYPLHKVVVLWQRDVDFRAYVFFKMDRDVESCQKNGAMDAIKNAVYEALEKYGRGKRNEIVVAFEWDSDENVDKKYDGDYLLRLR
jgi:hypothetical protein